MKPELRRLTGENKLRTVSLYSIRFLPRFDTLTCHHSVRMDAYTGGVVR